MRLTIYSWDVDVTGGGGWAISMRELSQLFADHGWRVRFVHSRADDTRSRGTLLGGPVLQEEQWADADVVWIYDSGKSTSEIIAHIGERKPIIVSWPTPQPTAIEGWLLNPNVWVLLNSPVIEALTAREGVSTKRVQVLPRGRRWSQWPSVDGARDKVGLPFGLKAPICGNGLRPGADTNHSPFPRFATRHERVSGATGLMTEFSAIDVARGIYDATGVKAIVTSWAPNEFKGASFIEVRKHVTPHTAMASFYAECRLFLSSLIWESFGVQPIEAQHHGVPVVYHREPDVQEPQMSFSAIGYTTLDRAIEAGVKLIEDDEWWRYWQRKSIANAARFDLDSLWPEYETFFTRVARCR